LKYFRKMFLAAAAAALVFAGFTTAASAYVGDWSYDDNRGGLEVLWLGDNSDGTSLLLRGTDRFCGRQGVPYATMRNILLRNGTQGEQVGWWINNSCTDGYVRVCVENWRGESACSTYWNGGWH